MAFGIRTEFVQLAINFLIQPHRNVQLIADLQSLPALSFFLLSLVLPVPLTFLLTAYGRRPFLRGNVSPPAAQRLAGRFEAAPITKHDERDNVAAFYVAAVA